MIPSGAARIEAWVARQPRAHIPVPRLGKIIAVGLNYVDHAAESRMEVPVEPVLFAKFSNSVIRPGEAIVIPRATTQVDFEAELGVVIGSRAARVSAAHALDHVAGYTCVNDVSARDLQFRTSQWLRGKAVDTFLPVGPWLVSTTEIPDPQALRLRCLVNGIVMQDAPTSDQIFPVAELISFVSRTITLEPGDLIATGTPPGTGFARTPPVFLHDGDVVTVEIDGIGELTNVVRCESV